MEGSQAIARPASERAGNRSSGTPEDASALAAFRRALLSPSRAALGLTLGVTLATWVLLVFGLTPGRMAEWAPYFAASRRDTCAFVTGRVEALRLAPTAAHPSVVFIGASGLRDAITTPEALAAELADRVPDAPDVPNVPNVPNVHWLVTDGQNMLESLSLVEALPPDFEGVIVLGVNPFRLGHGLAPILNQVRFEYRLGFRSRILLEKSAAAGIPLVGDISYFWDNHRFFLPRLRYAYKNTKRGAPEEFPRPPNREGGGHASPDAWQWFEEVTDGMSTRWFRQAPEGLLPMTEMFAALPNRERIEIVLLEGPVSQRARERYYGAEFYAKYFEHMERLAQDHGFEHWTLTKDAAITEGDFYDWGHLNNAEARERFTKVLADRLAPLLGE
jgi:hypothetical protein